MELLLWLHSYLFSMRPALLDRTACVSLKFFALCAVVSLRLASVRKISIGLPVGLLAVYARLALLCTPRLLTSVLLPKSGGGGEKMTRRQLFEDCVRTVCHRCYHACNIRTEPSRLWMHGVDVECMSAFYKEFLARSVR